MALRHRHGLNADGFSLAELLVVLAFIGILVTAGYPYVASYLQTAALKASAQELATVINGARQLAITRNTTVCVALNGTTAVYRTGVTNVCGGGTLFVGPNTASDGTIALDNRMQIAGTTANVVFSSLGGALQAGTYTVSNPTTGSTMSVVVSPAGKVTIQ